MERYPLDAILPFLKNDTPVLFALILLYVATKGIKYTVRTRIALVYALSFLILFFNSVDPYMALIEVLAILFLSLELFSSDEDLVRSFKFKYKFLDFSYRLFFEYHFGLYIFAFICLRLETHSEQLQPALQFVSILVLFWAISSTVHPKFSTKDITTVIHSLTKGTPITDFAKYERRRNKYEILAMMEDRHFFDRDISKHSFTCDWIAHEIQNRLSRYTLTHPIALMQNTLQRGYGTIEMQLIRTIGIDFGSYCYKFSRKIYEILYSNMILNSYLAQFSPENEVHQHAREWIAQCYIEHVSVKFGSNVYHPSETENTIVQVFGKTIDNISREEFFVWCLGLPHYKDGIGPIALELHANIIERLSLNRREVERIVEDVMASSI